MRRTRCSVVSISGLASPARHVGARGHAARLRGRPDDPEVPEIELRAIEGESEGKPQTDKEKEAAAFLRNDAQAREAFVKKVAAPVLNKMFECGMIP